MTKTRFTIYNQRR